MPDSRLVAGTMTGTSLDGLDAALIRVDGRGLGMKVRYERHRSFEFPADLATLLRAAAEQVPMTAAQFASLSREFGLFHAASLERFLGGTPVHLVVVHGQTVAHAPPVSWQLLQPATIATRLGTTVVADLRQVDLACGGQGAPITPLADWILFRGAEERAILNLGGFCNVTILPGGGDASTVRGFDACACNQVLDAVARRLLGQHFDVDGRAATRGTVAGALSGTLTAALIEQHRARRSLGTGDELTAWVEDAATRAGPDDVAATAAHAVGSAIGSIVAREGLASGGIAFLAGGGARHGPLARSIAASAGCEVRPLDALGIPIDAREAVEMAVLGALAADGVSITLPAVTGRNASCARDGAWWNPRRPA